MCLSRSGVQHQRLQPRVDDEGGDGVDQLGFQQFHRGHFVHQQAPGVAPAQIHLLQVLIQASIREQVLLADQLIVQQRHLRQLGSTGEAVGAVQAAPMHRRQRHCRGIAQQFGRAQAFVMADQVAYGFRQLMQRGGFAGHHVRVELRRAAHRLAGVVDDEVQPVTGGQQLAAERFHAGVWRRSRPNTCRRWPHALKSGSCA